MSVDRYPRYVRFEFKNGGGHDFKHIVEAMTITMVYARYLEIDRILVVVHTPYRDHYPVGELARHARMASEIFGKMRLAYLNVRALPHRLRFIHAALTRLGNTTMKSFNDEQQAIKWLLNDD